MDSKKSTKAKATKTVATKKASANTAKAPKKAAVAAKNFLFSIPSHHTDDGDFEHLVIAPNKEEACRLLADHRVTEKRPELQDPARGNLVGLMTIDYSHRPVVEIEPRKEEACVVQVNHQKIGSDLTLQ